MKNLSTAITLGFALFAMFFGAGNLILPPYIGLLTGENWWSAVAGFFTTGIVAPFLGILMIVRNGTSFADIGKRIHPYVITVLTFLIMMSIGPLVALPRTGATTFEVGVQPIFPQVNNVLFSAFFFIVVYLLSFTKSKIVDIIGNILTPFLLVSLSVLVIVGIINSSTAAVESEKTTAESFVYAFHQGYQTLDVLASIVFAGIIISAAIDKGYTDYQKRFKITLGAGLISMTALLFIYGGLIYLGAHAPSGYGEEVSRTELLLGLSNAYVGPSGTQVIAVAVSFACLTTAIALASATGSFLSKLVKEKIPYSITLFLTCLLSFYLSIKSVDEIIEYAVAILGFVYPITFILILTLLFFGKYVQYKSPYMVAIVVSATFSSISSLNSLGMLSLEMQEFYAKITFSQHQLEWVIPSFIGFFIAYIIAKYNRNKTSI